MGPKEACRASGFRFRFLAAAVGLTLAFAAFALAQRKRPPLHPGARIDARWYWFDQKLGTIRGQREVAGVMHMEIHDGHHGYYSAWLQASELADAVERQRGYRDAVRNFAVSFLWAGSGSQDAQAIAWLEKETGLRGMDAAAWRSWWDENGDFLRWNDAAKRYLVDRHRKAKRLSESVRGLRLSISLPKHRFRSGEPIEVEIRLENVGSISATLDRRLLWNAEASDYSVDVDLRFHEPGDVGYLHLRGSPAPRPPRRQDLTRLEPRNSITRKIEITSTRSREHLPLKPRRYAVKVSWEAPRTLRKIDPTTWVGTLDSLTELFVVE